MSDDYISHVSQRKELTGYKWDRTEKVEVTTLDDLIGKFGLPDFCKIDVEGFEPQVVSRLSSPLPILSFEHTLGMMERTERVIQKLDSLGSYEYNYSEGESMNLESDHWKPSVAVLSGLRREDSTLDIYARLQSS
jgi:Methyltransferase FkbM domain